MVEELRAHLGDEVSFQVPDGGFFIWVKFPEHVNTADFVQDANERGVSFIAGSQFFIQPEGARYARLSFSYCNEDQIRRGVKILAQSYRDYASHLSN
jgi:2-aminoadipate transaminase